MGFSHLPDTEASYDMSLQPLEVKNSQRLLSSLDVQTSVRLRGDSWLSTYVPPHVAISELAHEDLMMYIPDGIFYNMSLKELELFVQSIHRYSSPLKDITFGQLKNLHKNLWEKFVNYKNFFPELADLSLALYQKPLLDITYGELKEIPQKLIHRFNNKKKIIIKPLEIFIKHVDNEYNTLYMEPLLLEDITFSKLQKMRLVMEVQINNKKSFLKDLKKDLLHLEEMWEKHRIKFQKKSSPLQKNQPAVSWQQKNNSKYLEEIFKKSTSQNLEFRLSFKVFQEENRRENSLERISIPYLEKLLINDLEVLRQNLQEELKEQINSRKKQETVIIEDIKLNCHVLSKITNRIDEIHSMLCKA